MKLSSRLCAFLLAASVTALAAGAAAAGNINTSKSNTFRFDVTQTVAEDSCARAGGTISKESARSRTCTLPSTARFVCYNSCEACNAEAGQYGYACFMTAGGKCCGVHTAQ